MKTVQRQADRSEQAEPWPGSSSHLHWCDRAVMPIVEKSRDSDLECKHVIHGRRAVVVVSARLYDAWE